MMLIILYDKNIIETTKSISGKIINLSLKLMVSYCRIT